MALSIRDALEIDVLKDFKVIAGKGGLDKKFITLEIMDYEFTQGVKVERKDIISPESFVISTLLFAKDNELLLTETVKKLINLGVSGLAYKKIIFNSLPQDIINLANENDFPIIAFGGDEFFEDVIFEIRLRMRNDEAFESIERDIETLIENKLDKDQVLFLTKKINNGFLNNLKVFNIIIPDEFAEQMTFRTINNYKLNVNTKSKTVVGKYKGSIMIIASHYEIDPKRIFAIFNDTLYSLRLEEKQIIFGESNFCKADCLNIALREAYYARIVAEIEGSKSKAYKDIGLYKIIMNEEIKEVLKEYMKSYLEPIIGSKDEHSLELLSTAKQFVLAGGDIDKVAEKMFCHKNTVRYRMGKLQEKLQQNNNEETFFEELNMAMKILMVDNYLK